MSTLAPLGCKGGFTFCDARAMGENGQHTPTAGIRSPPWLPGITTGKSRVTFPPSC